MMLVLAAEDTPRPTRIPSPIPGHRVRNFSARCSSLGGERLA